MAGGIRFCHTYLHVAQVKQHTVMRESHVFCVRFSHGRVLFDSLNVQKCVTQIIYLWPLPTGPLHEAATRVTRNNRGIGSSSCAFEIVKCTKHVLYACCMNKNVLPTFQTFRPVGVQTAQMVINFAHFQVQAWQRGVSGQTGGCIVNVHIHKRGV